METVDTHAKDKLPLQQCQDIFLVKSGKSFYKIGLVHILYIEGKKEYIQIVTPCMKLMVFRRLKDIEESLPWPLPASTIHTLLI